MTRAHKKTDSLVQLLGLLLLLTLMMPAAFAEDGRNPVKGPVQVGDQVFFGSYEQDNDAENGKEAIEWTVLDVQGDRALLLSRHALDSLSYHTTWEDTTWENCSLRSWLNDRFLKSAFSDEEQAAILTVSVDNNGQGNSAWSTDNGNNTSDKVFLLSYKEAENYFSTYEERICSPTQYAVTQGAFAYSGNGNGWWWLRSTGRRQSFAAVVMSEGLIGVSYYNDCSCFTVRPAIWISLSDA